LNEEQEVHIMTRTTQQVFDAHRAAFEPINLEKLMADYADDAVMVTLDSAHVGKGAIQGFFENAFKAFPNLKVSFDKTAVEGDTFLLSWSGESDVATFPHGVATFIVHDGLIQRQIEWFVVVPKEM
jgi:ketosteroid isomerase-like protein